MLIFDYSIINKTKATTMSERKLPTKPSDLIVVALADLNLVEKTPGFLIDMYEWYSRYKQTCTVCLAGAVMAMSLKHKDQGTWNPSIYNDDNYIKLLSINNFRSGNIESAIRSLHNIDQSVSLDKLPEDLRYVFITPYECSKDRFKDEMTTLAAKLRRAGL